MRIKVEGHTSLVRDIRSNAIVNENISEYQLYMNRVKSRQQQGDEIRSVVKEINSLRTELEEIKGLLKQVIKK